MPVESEDPNESAFELKVSEGVAEGVDGAVKIAKPVRDVVENGVDTLGAEADDHRHDVPRSPAEHEGPQDDRNRPQSLQRSVLAPARPRITR